MRFKSGRHDTQHDDIQHKDTQLMAFNITIKNAILSIMTVLLCWVSQMRPLCWVSLAKCRFAESHNWALHAECHYAECLYAECRSAAAPNRSHILSPQWKHRIMYCIAMCGPSPVIISIERILTLDLPLSIWNHF